MPSAGGEDEDGADEDYDDDDYAAGEAKGDEGEDGQYPDDGKVEADDQDAADAGAGEGGHDGKGGKSDAGAGRKGRRGRPERGPIIPNAPPYKIYVSHLPNHFSVEDIKTTFEAAGAVEAVDVVPVAGNKAPAATEESGEQAEAKSKQQTFSGRAVVTFADVEGLKRALEMSGTTVDGSQIFVKIETPNYRPGGRGDGRKGGKGRRDGEDRGRRGGERGGERSDRGDRGDRGDRRGQQQRGGPAASKKLGGKVKTHVDEEGFVSTAPARKWGAKGEKPQQEKTSQQSQERPQQTSQPQKSVKKNFAALFDDD